MQGFVISNCDQFSHLPFRLQLIVINLTKREIVFYFTIFNHCVTPRIVGCWPDGYRTTQPFGNDIKALRNNTWQRFCMNEFWKEAVPFLQLILTKNNAQILGKYFVL